MKKLILFYVTIVLLFSNCLNDPHEIKYPDPIITIENQSISITWKDVADSYELYLKSPSKIDTFYVDSTSIIIDDISADVYCLDILCIGDHEQIFNIPCFEVIDNSYCKCLVIE